MASISWRKDGAERAQIESLIKEVETMCSAEIVITVRPRSGAYRQADYLFGAICAFVGLCVYIYAPPEFTDDLVPPALLLLFVAGAVFCANVAPLRRLLLPKALQARQVRAAAREAFLDQGIAGTRDRTGILIYISVFERRAEVITDIGILRRESDGQPAEAIRGIERAVTECLPMEGFVSAVRGLCAWLKESLPPRADDINELSDEVR
ncbi:hypothetical protein [Polyangium jinanense]|uniref:TPM domain-containing protein n=1 Tax=Polyangium jinanense TaxID=2829994 RepID=A0A9X4AU36_9BACT|nr:hypothetical protein [Polyangium jinanense]MDC3961101.1 hypothetical protein [Polyangium jinanense]MDC3982822.1 hypothetical protein [Polyangium jinanense]